MTPDLPPERLVELAAQACRGGVEMVQLRHKGLARGELVKLARRLREVAQDALLIVNDHADVAVVSGADGVHLGQGDLSIQSARRVLGAAMLIGSSASDVAGARAAIMDGADYIGCGAAFATPLKPDRPVIGSAGVVAVSEAVAPTPVFAIGGIDLGNARQLLDGGVRRICVIRAIAGAHDPAQAASSLRAMLES